MAKRHIEPLQSARLRLRLLEEADLPMTLAWRNQDHIRRWFLHSDVISPAQHREWYAQYRERDDDFLFVIEETDALRRPIGQVGLYHIDWVKRRAEFGRLLIGDAGARRRGLAKEATSCLVDAALVSWQIDEVYLEVMPENSDAVAVYEAAGFLPEATLKTLRMSKRIDR